MIEIHDTHTGPASPSARLTLPFEARQRSRLRATLSDGREVGLFLARGTVLRGGDRLVASDGTVVEVTAAPESVSTVKSADPRALVRAAYHLGNRHVPVELGDGWIRYEHDHVLDAMVRGLGLEVHAEDAPFEPEAGAYHGHSHGAAGGHSHERSHEPAEDSGHR